MEASQMYCDLPPQSAYNFAAAAAAAAAAANPGYNHAVSLPPTPPQTEEDQRPTTATAVTTTTTTTAAHRAPSKRPAAAAASSCATAPDPQRALREHKRPCRRESRDPCSPEIDIVGDHRAVVRSFSPEALKPRQEKIWRPYGSTDE